MPSSTFSSSDRIPGGQWLRMWLLALAATSLVLGSWEGFWRLRGFTPGLVDDVGLWAMARSSVGRNNTSEVVLIGASRVQLAVDLDQFAAAFGGSRPVQLAIDGASPVPVLDHLSQDNSFCGIVVCAVTPSGFFGHGDIWRGTARQHIRFYEERPASSGIEQRLKMLVQRAFVSRHSALSPWQIYLCIRQRRWPDIPYLTIRSDRSRPADYGKVDLPRLRRVREERTRRGGRGVAARELDRRLQRIKAVVDRIRGRGGKVAFVRMPSTGVIREIEKERFPKARYWDVFAVATKAVTIHFEDYPELSAFECPEGSHLDFRDAKRFTKALARILADELQSE